MRMDNWMKLHYGDREADLAKALAKAHGKNAFVQIGRKGGISVYKPIRGSGGAGRVAFYSCLSDLIAKAAGQ